MYDERTLSKKIGKRIGDWEGRSVYVCGKQDLKEAMLGVYHLLYNDNNKLVYNSGFSGWKVYGKVDREGNVIKVTPYAYEVPGEIKTVKKEVAEVKKPVEKKKRVEIDIDAYINEINNLTIEQMLEGVRGKF